MHRRHGHLMHPLAGVRLELVLVICEAAQRSLANLAGLVGVNRLRGLAGSLESKVEVLLASIVGQGAGRRCGTKFAGWWWVGGRGVQVKGNRPSFLQQQHRMQKTHAHSAGFVIYGQWLSSAVD
eukprot:353315-Chlamydomonas_euryale.AAC.3